MLVNISAIWFSDWRDYGTTAAFYDVPDEHCRDEGAVLSLFGRIARDFATETDDECATEQIGYGFDWGIFIEYVDDGFLKRYGVKRVEYPKCMAIDVNYNEIVSDYK
jgi:hypothetical protein